MLLAIDVGNTNTVLAIFNEADECVVQWRLVTNGHRTADEYAATVFPLLAQKGLQASDITAAIASFVVPMAVYPIRRFCTGYFNVEPLVVGDPQLRTGLDVRIDRPQELGADMIINAVAAWERYRSAVIIVDFGTATTFQVTNGKGEFIGGAIAPGINLSIEALRDAAAALPSVEVAQPPKVIGTGTITAIQSGIFYGYVGLIEGIVNRMKAEYGEEMRVLATGGLAPLFEKATPVIDAVEQDLSMRGLFLIYKMNK